MPIQAMVVVVVLLITVKPHHVMFHSFLTFIFIDFGVKFHLLKIFIILMFKSTAQISIQH